MKLDSLKLASILFIFIFIFIKFNTQKENFNLNKSINIDKIYVINLNRSKVGTAIHMLE